MEFDVRTDEISVKDGFGKDLTVNFYTPDIDNRGKFYTDSNGLEMQKRHTKAQDVSASFFPVTSAIVIRDDENSMEDGNRDQLTVLTSRVQGGASLREGLIEVVHGRRLIYDDRLTKEIVLNDTDLENSLQSKYYVQIFDRKFEESHQRVY